MVKSTKKKQAPKPSKSTKKKQATKPSKSVKKKQTSDPKKKHASSRSTKKAPKAEPSYRFPIDDIHELLETKFPSGEVKDEAAIFMTGVLEYLCAEMTEMSNNVARSRGGKGVTVEDIVMATELDPEFKELLDKVRDAKLEKNK